MAIWNKEHNFLLMIDVAPVMSMANNKAIPTAAKLHFVLDCEQERLSSGICEMTL